MNFPLLVFRPSLVHPLPLYQFLLPRFDDSGRRLRADLLKYFDMVRDC